jgi:hypothetical protein
MFAFWRYPLGNSFFYARLIIQYYSVTLEPSRPNIVVIGLLTAAPAKFRSTVFTCKKCHFTTLFTSKECLFTTLFASLSEEE